MSYLTVNHRIGEGVHFEVRDVNYDLVIRGVAGSRKYPEAVVEFKSDEKSQIINLKRSTNIRLLDGLDIMVADSNGFNKKKHKRVKISYHTNYYLERRKYE